MPSREPKRITLPMFYLLLTLVDGESHGYAMGQQVRERSGGSVELGPASLYWTINRLQGAGLIEELEGGSGPDSDAAAGKGSKGGAAGSEVDGRARRRRNYRLTAPGRAVLERETATWQQVISFARSKKIGRQEA